MEKIQVQKGKKCWMFLNMWARVYIQNRMARVSLKINMQLTCDLAIILLGTDLREMKTVFTQKPIREFLRGSRDT